MYPTEKTILLIVGTRPDIIKMAPIYHALKNSAINTIVCSTDQHTDLAHDLFDLFQIHPDIHLHVMQPNQDLFHITTTVLNKLKELYRAVRPDLVIVQGDTTSAMSAALAAFYAHIPVAHVEAGLRTHNMQSPFPEELNRQMISLVASYHFAPTQRAAEHLLNEGIDPSIIFITGNTVVDALHWILEQIAEKNIAPSPSLHSMMQTLSTEYTYSALFTAHRRESLDSGLEIIFKTLQEFLEQHPEVCIIYPMHPNPLIHHIFHQSGLSHLKNLIQLPPLSYIDLIYTLCNVNFVITDSGGLQEEAASLGKYTVVLREITERTESIDAGLSTLTGYDPILIKTALEHALKDSTHHRTLHNAALYGDGTAGVTITQTLIAHMLHNDI